MMVTLLCVEVPKIKPKVGRKLNHLQLYSGIQLASVHCMGPWFSLCFSRSRSWVFCFVLVGFFLKRESKCSGKEVKGNIAILRSNPSNRSAFAFYFCVKLILLNSAFSFLGLGSIRFECTSEPWM